MINQLSTQIQLSLVQMQIQDRIAHRYFSTQIYDKIKRINRDNAIKIMRQDKIHSEAFLNWLSQKDEGYIKQHFELVVKVLENMQ